MPEAAYLLTNAGWFLREQAQFTQAAPLLQQALTLAERALGSDNAYLGVILDNLAILYQDQGRYAEAEPGAIRSRETMATWGMRGKTNNLDNSLSDVGRNSPPAKWAADSRTPHCSEWPSIGEAGYMGASL